MTDGFYSRWFHWYFKTLSSMSNCFCVLVKISTILSISSYVARFSEFAHLHYNFPFPECSYNNAVSYKEMMP